MALATDDPRHGTLNAYTNHKCRCEPCKQAKRDDWAAFKAARGTTIRERVDTVEAFTVRTDQELPFHHPLRMRRNISQVISIEWPQTLHTPVYSVALNLEHTLNLLAEHGLLHVLVEDAERRERLAMKEAA